MPFAINDHVKPKPCWLRGPDSIPVPPSGRVRDAKSWGDGQVLLIEGDHRWYCGGTFDRDEAG